MKKILLALVSIVTSLVLPGCLQSEVTIHLNNDGSGTLVEETRLGAQMQAMLEQMSGMGGGDNAKANPLQQMFSEAKAKTRATELGAGVTLAKFETVDVNGAKGARVTYNFQDINKLHIAAGDSMKNISPMGAMPRPPAKPEGALRFAYAAGNLSIKMPDPGAAAKSAGPEVASAKNADMPEMDTPETQAMMKKMLGDMKMSLKLVVDSGIAATTATYQDGNTITLMEMEMGKMLEVPETFKKLGKLDKNNPAAAMAVFKNIKGFKVETQQEVTVNLK